MKPSKKNRKQFSRVVFSSKTYKWGTPQDVFNELHKEFDFTMDPARPPLIGGFEGNALKENWKGRVFCNPPYSRTLTKRWIHKAWQELATGRIELVVLLLPSRTGNDWFHFLHARGAEFRISRGRLKFGDKTKLGAPFDSIIAILRRENAEWYISKLTN